MTCQIYYYKLRKRRFFSANGGRAQQHRKVRQEETKSSFFCATNPRVKELFSLLIIVIQGRSLRKILYSGAVFLYSRWWHFNSLDRVFFIREKFTQSMQLYHHPFSLDSQKVRLVLEEKGIDYTSYHVNPLTGKHMDSSFFRMNPSSKLPVLQNGSHIIYRVIDIVQYIERVTASLNGGGGSISDEVMLWMQQIEDWNPKIFTLSHIPDKYRLFVSKFVRRVVIARMADAPDLASIYHAKLREAYETEDKLMDPEIAKQSEEKLIRLLDEAEAQLNETKYLAGEEFTLADSMFIPVLVRLALLNLEKEHINGRPRLAEYYGMIKHRSSYKVVIGRYFSGWRKYRTLLKTICFLCVRSMFRKY